MPYPFDTAFMERALLELLMLAVVGGVLGAWIVLRRMAFFSHAVGTATFPGLVVADAAGVPAQAAALISGAGFSGGVGPLGRERRVGDDTRTAMLLVGALALGIVLAGDVFEAGAGVDRLLFGSLLGLSDLDLWLTAGVAAAVLGADRALRRPWTAAGFDPAWSAGWAHRADRAFVALIAAAVVVALSAVGALLVTAILVVPAATARLLTSSVGRLQAVAVLLAAGEGVVALAVAREWNVGPGAALAVVAALVFAAVAVARRPR